MPPIKIALVVRPAGGGTQTTWPATNAAAANGFSFALSLPPGRYRVRALQLTSASLSPGTFAMPSGGPSFTVPATGCAYIGQITIVLYRLPPGTLKQQASVADRLARLAGRKTGYFVYLKTGGLLGDTASVASLAASERPRGSQACPVRRAKF